RRLFSGSCSKAEKINIAGHVIINALSTVLLSASNYCMQCVSAPTREEVDNAHRKRRWLDIGTPSARNLRSIHPAKTILWLFLGTSSFPLHLFYNSALFTSIRPSEYTVVSAVERFTQPEPPLYKPDGKWSPYDRSRFNTGVEAVRSKLLAGQLERLENVECLDAYTQPFQSSRADLVLVQNGLPGSLQLGDVGQIFDARYETGRGRGHISQPFYFLCDDLNAPNNIGIVPCEELLAGVRANISSSAWVVWKRNVRYCLSEKAPDVCNVYFNTTIAALVVSINLAKLIAFSMLFVVIRTPPLLTIGEAVASFLNSPDEMTEGLSPMSKTDIRQERWIAAVGYLVLFALCFLFFWIGMLYVNGAADIKSLWKIGFGTVDSRTIINFAGLSRDSSVPLITAILIANIPQPIISAAYFLYNSQITAMAMASEWDGFARERKALRVSFAPTGAQRSSHLLQLPYRFSVPLMVLSGVLHWVASQSIFLVDVERPIDTSVRPNAKPATYITTCGYSPVAILIFICLGVVMISFLLGLSFRQLKTGMPVAGSCSAAISAACHLPDSLATPDAAEKPLQWGEIHVRVASADNGHSDLNLSTVSRRCAFSPEDVTPPVAGVTYT
ncbi:hypothetical protein B0T14DRAFT_441918, partial [Immersiella caudata]